METTITINLDDYLSESEKKEYITKIVKEAIEKEIQKCLPDFKDVIVQKTEKFLNEGDLYYQIFKRKDFWGNEDSLAITYINETIKENEEFIKKRVEEAIKNYDFNKNVANVVSTSFSEMADNIKLVELFKSKQNNV